MTRLAGARGRAGPAWPGWLLVLILALGIFLPLWDLGKVTMKK